MSLVVALCRLNPESASGGRGFRWRDDPSPRNATTPLSGQGGDSHARISQRTLAKGLAWAAPAVVLAAPAPAAAASIQGVVVAATPCFKGSGTFGNNCATQLTTGNATSGNGGGYGIIKFRLRTPCLPALRGR